MLLRRLSLAFRPAIVRFSSATNTADADAAAPKAVSAADKIIAGQTVAFNDILQVKPSFSSLALLFPIVGARA